MVTLDVSSLYTNTLREEGIAALMETHEGFEEENELDGCTLDALVRFVIELNSFEFHTIFFLQINGTAMETKIPELCKHL